ncbi:hypothetical protein MVES1_000793, partial [Malassezia vespertilionis]
ADGWKKDARLPIFHRMMSMFGVLPPRADEVHKAAPGEKIPVFSELNQLVHLAPPVFLPFVARHLYYHYVSHDMGSPWVVWFLMFTYTMLFGMSSVLYMNRLVRRYGYLDGDVGRDTLPYNLIPKVIFEMVSASMLRPALVVLACYDPTEVPTLTIWLPVQLFLLTLTEDFYYYWGHRLCHEAESAWKIHRLHHTTKHPTTMLLAYADEIQEVFDIVGAPTLSWLTCPFGFDVTIVWMLVHLHLQLGGHSGLRLHVGSVLTGPFLRPFGWELVVEDHDLHHRHGWKDSYNYGKQSRFWDNLHGSAGDRIEGQGSNLDWNHYVSM